MTLGRPRGVFCADALIAVLGLPGQALRHSGWAGGRSIACYTHGTCTGCVILLTDGGFADAHNICSASALREHGI
jgi:hypothetical protein